MSKQEEILLSKPPNVFFDPNSNLTIQNLKEELLIPYILSQVKEGENKWKEE